MESKTVLILGLGGSFLFIMLGIFNLLPWTIAGVLATASIGAAGLLFNYLSKKKEKPSVIREKETIFMVPGTERAKPLKIEVEKPITLVDQAPVIDEDDYVTYEIELEEGENLKGEVKADGPINVFLLTKRNLTNFENDEEFWYEDGDEEVTRTTIDFEAPKNGKWFLVVENIGEEAITADIRLHVV